MPLNSSLATGTRPGADSETSADETATSQYRIAASATLQERRTRTLKHDDTFAVFDYRGDIGSEPGSSEGLYQRDTRILSKLTVLLEEARPLLLSSTIQDDNTSFSADLSNPDLLIGDVVALRREQIHLHRLRFLWNGACYERLLVRNFSDQELCVRLAVCFDADFADLFEVRGEHRSKRGQATATRAGDAKVVLSYLGLDSVERTTTLQFYPAPQTLTTKRAGFELLLRPHQVRRIFIRAGSADAIDAVWGGRFF
jgi:glycogen debranching enzyme